METNQKCLSSDDVLKETVFITWVGFVVNILLALLKFILGYFGKSAALIADSVHSLSDTVTDFVVILGAKYWSAPADDKHPYGHGRIENMLSGIIGAVLVITGIALGYNAISSLCAGKFFVPHPIAFIAAIASVITKELLYHITYNKGEKLRSKALMANAWHHRSDALSSVTVVIALLFCMILGSKWAFLDVAGSFVVSLFIIYAGWAIVREAFDVLADKSVSIAERNQIIEIALAVDEVMDIHALRTRILGGSIFVDMHIVVSRNLTVYQGHNVAGMVKKMLKDNINGIIDVVVHIEPDTVNENK